MLALEGPAVWGRQWAEALSLSCLAHDDELPLLVFIGMRAQVRFSLCPATLTSF